MKCLENIVKDIGIENFSILIKELSENLNQKDKMFIYESFREIEFPLNEKITTDIAIEDIDNLKYSEEITEVNRTFFLYFQENQLGLKGHINVKNQKIDVVIPLSPKKRREFLKKYNKEKSLLCKGQITYSMDLELFFIFNLKIYRISNPFEKWKNLMLNKTLKEKFDILLAILGLNTEVLLYHEKFISIARLIPLVVKKTLMVEISIKEIGKTYSYETLGFNLYNTDVTKATTFIDGRNKKEGDFFSEDIVYIIDEFHKIKQAEEIITPLQLYMSGNKYQGKIQISGVDKREIDISSIILANAKIDIDLLTLFINNKGKNGEPISLFENTSILNSPDGEAFVSRITLLPNSWGCRTFSSFMKSNDSNFYNIELLKAAIPILRNKEFDTKIFYDKMGLSWENPSIRSSESAEKNFEGFVKLLFPELLADINQNEISKHIYELQFLWDRAFELRKTIDNQLKVINPSNNKEQTLPYITTSLRNTMFNITEPHLFTPHRIFINKGNGLLEKKPLDTMGVKMNIIEKNFLESNNYQVIFNNGVLTHDINIINQIFLISTYLQYNYLTGEFEYLDLTLENFDFISKRIFYNFYDLINN